ncbi:MAG: hypothetical protein LBH32_09715 [Dysgonamonadaceae bacterium]|jgi:hypothetical protein|nr:hypothetical protein [Dysgonamonadaceae bacterium]
MGKIINSIFAVQIFLAVALCLSGCKRSVPKAFILDVVLTSGLEYGNFPEDLQKLYEPVSLEENDSVFFVSTGIDGQNTVYSSIKRIDLNVGMNLKTEKNAWNKFISFFAESEKHIKSEITSYFKELDINELNAKSNISDAKKNTLLKDYIRQNDYSKVIFYDNKGEINYRVWNGHTVYTDIEGVRRILSKFLANNYDCKFLVVCNPPMYNEDVDKTASRLVAKKAVVEPIRLTLQPIPVVLPNATPNIKSTPASASIPAVPASVTVSQLNSLLNSIAKDNDAARDEMRKFNNVRVVGAANISNVYQLVTDVSNGNSYTVTDIQTDGSGKVVSINVRK